MWNKVTKLDVYKGFATSNVDSCSQFESDAMSTSCSSSQDSTAVRSKHPLPDADNSLPASKRPSSSSTKDQYANPIDDRILSKRIGDLTYILVKPHHKYVVAILHTNKVKLRLSVNMLISRISLTYSWWGLTDFYPIKELCF